MHYRSKQFFPKAENGGGTDISGRVINFNGVEFGNNCMMYCEVCEVVDKEERHYTCVTSLGICLRFRGD